MKAIGVHRFGEADCLSYDEAPEPVLLDDEILIRVLAAGVNPVAARIRSGTFARFSPRLPAIPGRDVSGAVATVGRNVSGFAEGDTVFGMLDYDRRAYAEYAVASAREITRVSAALEHSDLAALPVAALTAWQALFEHGKLRNGQRFSFTPPMVEWAISQCNSPPGMARKSSAPVPPPPPISSTI